MNPAGYVILAAATVYFLIIPAAQIARDYWHEHRGDDTVDD